jgi:hypothetical protein
MLRCPPTMQSIRIWSFHSAKCRFTLTKIGVVAGVLNMPSAMPECSVHRAASWSWLTNRGNLR